jgi:hypothetical protein
VGVLWFDNPLVGIDSFLTRARNLLLWRLLPTKGIITNIHFQHCVVIGMEGDESSENKYKRLGVGWIKARCVSKESCEEKLL